jgi:hypothetical protein
MGRKLIEGTLPDIANQLERIANALEKKQDIGGTPVSALKTFIKNYPNDEELGKQIRKIWEK